MTRVHPSNSNHSKIVLGMVVEDEHLPRNYATKDLTKPFKDQIAMRIYKLKTK